MVVSCLSVWGLDHVFSLTVDNASSNDTGIEYLKRGLRLNNTLVLNGDYMHMRCCAHILNLIVKDGLKEVDDSILRIRAAVKYIKSSSSRLAKFKVCIEKQKIESNCLVSLDVETRWNSTYLMLDSALKHQKAFELLELEDKKYVFELQRGKGVPEIEDWNYARTILPFLKIFYEVTLRISSTSYATIVLDPRCKMDILTLLSDDNRHFDCGELANLKKKLDSCLNLLFEAYNDSEEGSQRNSQGAQLDDDDDDIYGVPFRKRKMSKSNGKSELDVYLEEALENPSPSFDILAWWKVQSSRFPIIANIAREVLAIPISIVASESAFSIGGRVLDHYCSCLTPQIVESLICTQDWLKGTPFEMRSTDGLEEELQKVEHGTTMLSFSQQNVDCVTSVATD
ncbi:zinc finger BED domain-containing protein RICESLEEPER 4-like [Gastrolobium bilobum]|uniref:zinc finger BED domain-containing protein RICESLEEPER 4-like n=1 Tax=Gastrolobium bilobum TaxID=150636 RepID=UPI002AB2F8AD|nr:zinc finger BED domain-containing protein RICESLEEPER 4-like [Gastrolobium bilobum]